MDSKSELRMVSV